MSIDLGDITHQTRRHETSIARHLIHHPEDEYHPLMQIIADILEDLVETPALVAGSHEDECRNLMHYAKHEKRYMNRDPSDLVALARWHNWQAVAARRTHA